MWYLSQYSRLARSAATRISRYHESRTFADVISHCRAGMFSRRRINTNPFTRKHKQIGGYTYGEDDVDGETTSNSDDDANWDGHIRSCNQQRLRELLTIPMYKMA
jgi:hypothetical protein